MESCSRWSSSEQLNFIHGLHFLVCSLMYSFSHSTNLEVFIFWVLSYLCLVNAANCITVVVSVGLQQLPTLEHSPQRPHETQLSARIENQRAVVRSLETSRPLLPAGILFCSILPWPHSSPGTNQDKSWWTEANGNPQRGDETAPAPWPTGYNAWRCFCGLSRPQNLAQLSRVLKNECLARTFLGLHGTPDNTVIWIRAITESLLPGARVGCLLASLFENQFRRARDGDG